MLENKLNIILNFCFNYKYFFCIYIKSEIIIVKDDYFYVSFYIIL